VVTCCVDWDGFDLMPPDDLDPPELVLPCTRAAEYRVIQACVHEHVTDSLACAAHLDMMRGLYPLAAWGCGRCIRGALPHMCIAPMTVLPLEACDA
jgi:hypothetical protein